jgi:HEAT repeat protein
MVVLAQASNKSSNAEWLTQMLQFLAQLAELLSVPPDVLTERLMLNAMTDPCPGVRLRNLRFLIDPDTRATLPVLMSTARALVTDANAPVRLLAARQLGEEGHPALAAIALDAHQPATVRVEALQALGLARASKLESLLPQLLGANPPELVCAALSIIAARRLSALAESVVQCAASQHEAVRAGAARALLTLPTQHSEQALIRLLADSSSEVKLISAESLGAIGSVAAVEPLLGLANSFGRAQVRQAARGAIGRIQSRLGDVEVGCLSLADEHGLTGALSVADEAAAQVGGEVSLVEESTTTNETDHVGVGQHFSWLEEPSARRTR